MTLGNPSSQQLTAQITSAVATPEIVAAALQPDHTDDVVTQVTDNQVQTTIQRDSPGSLEATLDDYIQNLRVAIAVTEIATAGSTQSTLPSDVQHINQSAVSDPNNE